MAVVLGKAVYREAIIGRDGMERALAWQGNAGSLYGLNMVYARPIVATGTTTSKVKTTAAADFVVGGTIFNKAATDDFWTLSGAVVAISSWQKYILCVDDGGVATALEATQSNVSAAAVTFGNIAAAAKAFPQNPWAPLITILSASRCVFGVLTVATNASTTFTPGTTLLGAAGITATYINGLDPLLLPLVYGDRNQLLGTTI